MMKNRLVLKFPRSLVEKPVLSDVVKKFDLDFNVLRADISPNSVGVVVVELMGRKDDYKAALVYLCGLNVEIQTLSKDIVRFDDLCTHCTACVGHCPSGALFVEDRKTMKVGFDPKKCVACEACIPVCPYKALNLKI